MPHYWSTRRLGSAWTRIAEANPEFIKVSGARIVGTDDESNDVLEITAGAAATSRVDAHRGHTAVPAVKISVSSADSVPVVAGRLLTGLALAMLAFELLLIVVVKRLERR